MALKLEDFDTALREYNSILAAGDLSTKVGTLVRSKWEEAMAAKRNRARETSLAGVAEPAMAPPVECEVADVAQGLSIFFQHLLDWV
eukprot:CAMPEP_0119395528 /NCGR_PEP_ID=MMETSP1334-20130426/133623_1 /TAXON_ID=127549 /ORGANISM="Calcidiscus leptoporus, Strain RCC1130" /LENGTH=86 /DNA_ID=CAMNT_0007419023 /DNA_START=71 /DNA_END=327 /DNA_ORIENTATION=+